MVRIAILDLYEGQANQGMRCLREIVHNWAHENQLDIAYDIFDVRVDGRVPDASYDVYISSGGPGDPSASEGSGWEDKYFNWFNEIVKWNSDPSHTQKKYVFFICHSYQLLCRHLQLGLVSKRRSTAFGVFPVHMLEPGKHEIVFEGLNDPFYIVDSRDFQVTQLNEEKLKATGAAALCIEKDRPHVKITVKKNGVVCSNT
jgi:homoserine O-succinyltransferase/O-acetyltransferase